jgi:hypothetical protein
MRIQVMILTLKMEAARSFETMVFYHIPTRVTTWKTRTQAQSWLGTGIAELVQLLAMG